MTQLDEKVSILFERMIKSWDKISNIKNGTIEFDNGLNIYACKKSSKDDKESRENIPLELVDENDEETLEAWKEYPLVYDGSK